MLTKEKSFNPYLYALSRTPQRYEFFFIQRHFTLPLNWQGIIFSPLQSLQTLIYEKKAWSIIQHH